MTAIVAPHPVTLAAHELSVPNTTDAPMCSALENATRDVDRAFRSARAGAKLGLSPEAIAEAYFDWLSHLATSPGKQVWLRWKAWRKAIRPGWQNTPIGRPNRGFQATDAAPGTYVRDRRFLTWINTPTSQTFSNTQAKQEVIMQQEPTLSQTTISTDAAAAAQRRLACFTHAWTDFALDAMKAATSEVDVMRSLFAAGGLIGQSAYTAENPAAACRNWVQQATSRYGTLIVAQRNTNDAMVNAVFRAWGTLADALPTSPIAESATADVPVTKSVAPLAANQAA